MGMYDSLICKYPLPEPADLMELKIIGLNNLDFQTKDLENGLLNYTIREDGTLWETRNTYEFKEGNDRDKEEKYLFSELSEPKLVKSEEIQVNYHGSLYFYDYHADSTLNNDYYIEFLATFSRGQLENIVLHKFEAEDNSKRKERDRLWKQQLSDSQELRKKWYMKYGYSYYAKFIHKAFRLYRTCKEKLPSSIVIERFFTPL